MNAPEMQQTPSPGMPAEPPPDSAAVVDFSRAPAGVQAALAARPYGTPTPVQQEVLAVAPGRDLLVSAATGSGKTVAFGLALAQTLLGDTERLEAGLGPLALVVAPTRELALQVEAELTWLLAGVGARIVPCVGGMDPRRERERLTRGCHVVVGTPGRLHDHLRRGQLPLGGLRVLVLDEADEMLDLGFREDLEAIVAATPASRRTLLFSATLPKPIVQLAAKFQRDPVRIDTVGRNRPHADIEYRAHLVAPGETGLAVVNLLRMQQSPGALVFCGTREAVRHMHGALVERGFPAVALSGDMAQSERNRALASVRDGRATVCIATDVAARGLDLPSLDLVIHADLPSSRAALLHRSGRTGRAGRKGVCVVLVPADRRRRAETLFGEAGLAPEFGPAPGAEAVRARDVARLAEHAEFAAPPGEELVLARRLVEAHGAEWTIASLLRMVRASLPAPEDLTVIAASDRRRERVERPGRQSGPVRLERIEAGPRPQRAESQPEAAVLRIGIGRHDRADPKWLLPLLCRALGCERQAIGRITIRDRDSLFGVDAATVARFRAQGPAEAPDVALEEFAGIMPPPAPPRTGKFEGPSRAGKFENASRGAKAGGAPRAGKFDGAPRGRKRGV